MNYSIEDTNENLGGDKIEKSGWPMFGKEKFPNYEIFWRKFVAPRTNRPHGLALKNGVSEEEAFITSLHYAIYYSFYNIYWWGRTNKPEKKHDAMQLEYKQFEHSFMKLGTIFDLTEDLLYRVLVLEKVIKPFNGRVSRRLNVDEKKVMRSVIKQYYPIDKTGYSSIAPGIREYRNIIVHSFHSFQINDMVPKLDFAIHHQNWSKATMAIKTGDKTTQDSLLNEFMEMRPLVLEQSDKLIRIVNDLWSSLIEKIGEVEPNSQHSKPEINLDDYEPFIEDSGSRSCSRVESDFTSASGIATDIYSQPSMHPLKYTQEGEEEDSEEK